MMTMKYGRVSGAALLAVALLGHPAPVDSLAAAVVINEFMASNGMTHADEDGDFEDWTLRPTDARHPRRSSHR
jgi:hypothetical protein